MSDPASEPSTNPTPEPLLSGVLHGYDELRRAVIRLVQSARRDIRLFAPRLNPLVFNTASVTDALVAFAIAHGRNRVRVLVEDSEQVLRDVGRLVTGARRLGGNLELREVDDGDRGSHDLYLVADRSACLIQSPADEMDAVISVTPPQPANYSQRFDAAWERAQPIALRTLGL